VKPKVVDSMSDQTPNLASVSLGQALQQACAGFSPDFMAEGRPQADDDPEDDEINVMSLNPTP
jgi:hypothetical protein